MFHILVISGTAREGNYTQHVAKFVAETLKKHDEAEVKVIDPASLKIQVADEAQGDKYPKLKQMISKADGFVIVAPEYNHGYPGSLKLLLDLNLKEYIHKPVGLVGVSAGSFGGARVIESLVPVVRELGMAITYNDLNVSSVSKEIQNGEFVEPAKWQRRSEQMISELFWLAEVLKWGRENVKS